MSGERANDPAEHLFAEGKKYDWKQDKSPAAASLARANFQQAALMEHRGAMRALAHMIYDGRGGPQDKKQALLLLWSAFRCGDQEALEELGDLLASYAEQLTIPSEAKQAAAISETIGQLDAALSKVLGYMGRLVQAKS